MFNYQKTAFILLLSSTLALLQRHFLRLVALGHDRQVVFYYSSGGTGLPTTTRVPRLIIDNASFGKVVGLTAGTYPSASATVSSARLSSTIPQIHPTSSYIVRCDLIKNEYVASGDILSAFDGGDAQVGQLISYKPSQYAWMNYKTDTHINHDLNL
ncbi:unnamed protein product [Phytophthora lilii]|uniref:Unnamed protein product n=1 Tax=Phytophthora lilii TaxID=2077276 RepID=A0A9W6X3P5_9STRA|nr:unnamed protein product [Phytophthora lilii]